MRVFCMDLHVSVIADFKSLGLDVDVTDWTLSGHAYVMNRMRDEPKHINANTWESMTPELIATFQAEYDEFLSGFDGFLVCHAPCFAQIYEKYKKPVILINSCRIDLPHCFSSDMEGRARTIECLQRLNTAGLLIPVSNNRADQLYTLRATGIKTRLVPSLGLYTKMRYAPSRDTFLCYTGICPANPRITQKAEIGSFQWRTVAEFKGIVYFPYEVSTMSMFEHYSAGCPMFFPSKEFMRSNTDMLTSIRAYWGDRPVPAEYGDLSDISTWIDLADFYTTFESVNTQYFDSIDHLDTLLDSFVYVDDTDDRTRYIESVQDTWRSILLEMRMKKEPVHLSYNRLPVLANVVYDSTYDGSGVTPQHTYPTREMRPHDVVFVKTDHLDWFVHNRPVTVPITLVTGVSDLSPSPHAAAALLMNLNIRRWIGCNIRERHPKIRKVLIGVGEVGRPNGDHDTLVRLHDQRPSWDAKVPDVCVPYHGNTHSERALTPTLDKMEFSDYMQAIGKHQFVVCMRGNGIDTHRFSEILLMGSVPIVLHSELDDLYKQFPCLIVDSFDAVNTSGFVWDATKYDRFLDMFWLRPAGVQAMVS